MLAQITEALVSLFFLGLIAVLGLAFLSTLFGVPFLFLWPGPRREERSERVIIVNNTPPASAQPAGPSAWALLAPVVAALLVALTRRVESQQQALPAPDAPTYDRAGSWVEVEPGRWVRPRQTALVRRDDDYRS